MPIVASLANASARGLGMFGAVLPVPISVEYLVVGPGGISGAIVDLSGNFGASGGGGGGEMKTGTLSLMTLTGYTVNLPNTDSTVFHTISSAQGGAGADAYGGAGYTGLYGGGGAAADGVTEAAGVGSVRSGGSAFANNTNNNASGGGAGAGGNGGNASSGVAGAGGAGLTSSITGSSVTYSAGGAGRRANASFAGGGATPNTGNGANGASTATGQEVSNKNGALGIVILKIPNTFTATFSAGTNTLSTAVSGFNIYSCTSSGARTVTFR